MKGNNLPDPDSCPTRITEELYTEMEMIQSLQAVVKVIQEEQMEAETEFQHQKSRRTGE